MKIMALLKENNRLVLRSPIAFLYFSLSFLAPYYLVQNIQINGEPTVFFKENTLSIALIFIDLWIFLIVIQSILIKREKQRFLDSLYDPSIPESIWHIFILFLVAIGFWLPVIIFIEFIDLKTILSSIISPPLFEIIYKGFMLLFSFSIFALFYFKPLSALLKNKISLKDAFYKLSNYRLIALVAMILQSNLPIHILDYFYEKTPFHLVLINSVVTTYSLFLLLIIYKINVLDA